MINRVILTGRLTRDPDMRVTNGGMSVVSFSLAVDRNRKADNGPSADFPNCKAFGKTAEVINQYLRKGSLIGIEGRLQTGSYTNQQNQKVYTTDVIVDQMTFLESRNSGQQANSYQGQPNTSAYQNQPYNGGYKAQQNTNGFDQSFEGDGIDIRTDDLPF